MARGHRRRAAQGWTLDHTRFASVVKCHVLGLASIATKRLSSIITIVAGNRRGKPSTTHTHKMDTYFTTTTPFFVFFSIFKITFITISFKNL